MQRVPVCRCRLATVCSLTLALAAVPSLNAQSLKDDDKKGSWEPEAGWFGASCGRLGTTAVCVLNLEVYYRYVPHLKPDENRVKIIEDK